MKLLLSLPLPARLNLLLTLMCLLAMAAHFLLPPAIALWPLWAMLALGAPPMLWEILAKAIKRDFGADILAAIALVTAVGLSEYLAAVLIVLMLSSGQALEAYAMRKASSVLAALAERMPSIAHRKNGDRIEEIPLTEIEIGDEIVVYPHETAPVDGVVISGHGSMDESYLTGEPYRVSKAPGARVLSGAVNGDAAMVIRAEKLPQDSRYASIMTVMTEAEQKRPQLRRLGDQIGAVFAPLALALAISAWAMTGEVDRFLAVLVVATPCPLLIAIPVTIISAVSMAAKRGIIIRDPTVLERLPTCTTAIFDKTGTLTYGQPKLTEIVTAHGVSSEKTLRYTAALEKYSKHPLAVAILKAAEEAHLYLPEASEVSETPGQGLSGVVEGHRVHVTSRKKFLSQFSAVIPESDFLSEQRERVENRDIRNPEPQTRSQIAPLVHHAAGVDSRASGMTREQAEALLPPPVAGLECIVLLDGHYAATLRLRDAPRKEGQPFIHHLGPNHHFSKIMLVSGDRQSEASYLGELLGIKDIYASQSPEQKLAIVREEVAKAPTLFMGDGINDAPALTAATVGLAFGQHSSVTSEAAGAVILDNTLSRVDELIHLSEAMRSIALQSALGGMAVTVIAMAAAAMGYITPVQGALLQEAIDVVAIGNALRLAMRKDLQADV